VTVDALREAVKRVLMLIAAFYRDALVVRVGAESRCHLSGHRQHVQKLSGQTGGRLEDSLRAIVQAEQMLDRNVAPQLACEWLAAALCGLVPAA